MEKDARYFRANFLSKIKVFEAGVHNIVYFFQKGEGGNNRPERLEHDDDFGKVKVLPTDEQKNLTYRAFFPQEQGGNISGIQLEEICYVSFGCRLNSNEKIAKGLFVAADLVTEKKDKAHPKPYIEAKDIIRWTHNQYRWLEWGTARSPKLLTRPTFEELYEVPEKIVAADVSGAENRAAYDNNKAFHSHTLISFVPWHMLAGVRNNSIKKAARYSGESPVRHDLPKREDLEATSKRFEVKYLLAVMNSTVARDFLRANRRSNIHLYPDDWKHLPIPDVTMEKQTPIVELVDQILSAKKQHTPQSPLDRGEDNTDTSALEKQIDEMVYALYDLTPKEIAIVEGKG